MCGIKKNTDKETAHKSGPGFSEITILCNF